MTIIDEKKRGYALGATDYLVKPVDRAKLVGVLNSVCGCTPREVLVVDDDAEVRQHIGTALAQQGWSITEAPNGLTALAQLQTSRSDAVILDLMMPQMDGFEFLDEMRRNPDWRDIPVVVVTARSLSAEDRRRLNGGVERIIQKTGLDDMLQQMCDVLARCIGGRRGKQPAEAS